MAETPRAPKQWSLSKSESVNSFDNWRQNITYTLSLDPNFAPFLVDGVVWLKRSRADPNRGLTDDGQNVPQAARKTAAQKVAFLELMLGQIANYCPVISRNTIVKNSTSLTGIWQSIRLHYGFQSTGSHIIDLADMKLQGDERPEDLYQRILAFVDDNLLKRDGGLSHHGEMPAEDEEMSPTLENMVVLVWLQLIHRDLPRLVKQRYGTELRSRTLASIKPEISQALESLLSEIKSSEDVRVMRSGVANLPFRQRDGSQRSSNTRPSKVCPLCKQAGRADHRHFLSKCPHLPDPDRKFMTRARQVFGAEDSERDEADEDDEYNLGATTDVKETPVFRSATRRVQVKRSPSFDVFRGRHTVHVVVDSGAETNMIRESVARQIGARIVKTDHRAMQADGVTPLRVVGETRVVFSRGNNDIILEALVVRDLEVEVLCGMPCMELNEIALYPAKRLLIFADGSTYSYSSDVESAGPHAVRRTHAYILRAPTSATTVWPGEYIEVKLPEDLAKGTCVAIEPRSDFPVMQSMIGSQVWPAPDILAAVDGSVRIPNFCNQPVVLRKNEHFCQVLPAFDPAENSQTDSKSGEDEYVAARGTSAKPHAPYSAAVQLDPDNILSPEVKKQFREVITDFDDVFNPNFGGYNGAAGRFQAVVNMGPVQPPQRKGRLPQYSRNKLLELQQKFDELEAQGVFARPEDEGIVVEYLNPSFLVKKPNGGHRLVTAFADVGRYSKPQPALMPDVDTTLQAIGQWRHLIVTDLTSAFYQIPLSKPSMKYCGVATPFRGVRVYKRSAMGMPGSETALEELMCRVLGDLLQEGVVAKLADDLYCGGNTHEELLQNWRKVLGALQRCDLKLSASKTVVCPKTTTVLGWVWSQGSIHASPHRVAALSTCIPPVTVAGLRSFIGAYKVLARVLPKCADLVAPLDDAIAGGQSRDRVVWSDDLLAVFEKVKKSLGSSQSVVLPRPDDQLWIVTDAATKRQGLGATLYVTREGRLKLAGFYSAKLRRHQVAWLPCELEALCIAASIKHFSPFIVQSVHRACVLTDSKPCVQAFEKLCRGEFSASPRVSTFLSAVSRYQASVRHLAGTANVPADFASRNAPDCEDQKCQICTFIDDTQDSVVRNVSTQDILSGAAKLPFISRSAWLQTQSECYDLRRTHAHLVQGTRPSRKETNLRDVKRYLNVASVAKDGLLVVHSNVPLAPARELIIVPRRVLDGLLMALHIRLDHPTSHQLKLVTRRYFYALDLDGAIDQVAASCHQCASLRQVPHTLQQQSTGDPPEVIGVAFAADVIKRERQLILVLRETVTSYTEACLVESERHSDLRDALIQMCIGLRPLDGPMAVVRTDPAPGFVALVNDEVLGQHRICVEIGRVKNPNKNPVAERAVQELEGELLRRDPNGGPVSGRTLAVAVSNLNSRIRGRGLSSRELLYQRDQFTGVQLPIQDYDVILEQHHQRRQNHPYSEKAKNPGMRSPGVTPIDIGDLVYLHSDGDKSRARSRYLVVSIEGDWCCVRKFVGSQLRSTSYRVKLTECYKVLESKCVIPAHLRLGDEADTVQPHIIQEQVGPTPPPHPPAPPEIPCAISQPPQTQPVVPPLVMVDGGPTMPESQTDLDLPAIPSLPTSPVSEAPGADSDLSLRRSERTRSMPKHLQDYQL